MQYCAQHKVIKTFEKSGKKIMFLIYWLCQSRTVDSLMLVFALKIRNCYLPLKSFGDNKSLL